MESEHAPAGERYLVSGPWERDDLVANLTNLSGSATGRSTSAWSSTCCCAEDELGLRVGEGPGIGRDDVRSFKPLAAHGWGEEEQRRLENLGSNGPRDASAGTT